MAKGTIEIDACPDLILAQVSDLDVMAEWSGANWAKVLQVHPDGRPARARWSENYGPIPDEFVLDYEWTDSGVRWHLVEGRILQSEVGSIDVQEIAGAATRVTYELELGLAIPLPSVVTEQIAESSVKASLDALAAHVLAIRESG